MFKLKLDLLINLKNLWKNYEKWKYRSKEENCPVCLNHPQPENDIIDKEGKEVISLKRKFWSGSMKIIIRSNINPLLVLSYGLILSIMIAQDQAAAATTTSVH